MHTLEILQRDLTDCQALTGTYHSIGTSITSRNRAQTELLQAQARQRGWPKKIRMYLGCAMAMLIIAQGLESTMLSLVPESAATLDLCLMVAVFTLPAVLVHVGTIERRGAIRRAQRSLDEAQQELDKASRRFINGYRAQSRAVSLVDWNVPTLTALVGIVHRGRADTVKEALNVLETDRHRERLENHAQAQTALQGLVIEELKQVQRDIRWFS